MRVMLGEGMQSAKSGSVPLNSDGGEGGRKAMTHGGAKKWERNKKVNE